MYTVAGGLADWNRSINCEALPSGCLRELLVGPDLTDAFPRARSPAPWFEVRSGGFIG